MQEFIDVSEHNGDVDWRRAATRVKGAYVRIADGDQRDKVYGEERVKALRAAKLTWGPYYYARVASPANDQRNGTQEAQMAIEFARSAGWPKAGDLPLAYDFESLNQQPAAKGSRHLIQFIRAYRKRMGHLPVIYTMPGFWPAVERELNPRERALVSRCPLWIAHWRVSEPTVPEPWHSWSMWQDTDSARLTGVGGNVDHDRAAVALSRLTIRRLTQTEPPADAPEIETIEPKPKRPARAKAATGVPAWVPKEHWGRWQKPWSPAARNSQGFKRLLWEHGFASPNFSREETRCHDPARGRFRPILSLAPSVTPSTSRSSVTSSATSRWPSSAGTERRPGTATSAARHRAATCRPMPRTSTFSRSIALAPVSLIVSPIVSLRAAVLGPTRTGPATSTHAGPRRVGRVSSNRQRFVVRSATRRVVCRRFRSQRLTAWIALGVRAHPE